MLEAGIGDQPEFVRAGGSVAGGCFHTFKSSKLVKLAIEFPIVAAERTVIVSDIHGDFESLLGSASAWERADFTGAPGICSSAGGTASPERVDAAKTVCRVWPGCRTVPDCSRK